MKTVRYYTKVENEIYIHDEPTLDESAVCSIEYNSSMKEVRRLYSNFDLRPAWEN